MTQRLTPVAALMGIPIDVVDETTTVELVERAILKQAPLFLTTPNLNFLIGCQSDARFRLSVLQSDLSVADGMPLVWMARCLGIHLPGRVAGSSVFQRLESGTEPEAIRVCFFGGPPGVAQAACENLNRQGGRLVGSGAVDPGFGDLNSMGEESLLSQVRQSQADFLVVALGAAKGQEWILRHRHTVGIPVISHLGAVVNFVAGSVRRSPLLMQRTGLEWLWRIREEPSLWRRYWRDGVAGLKLLLGTVLPHAAWLRWHRVLSNHVKPTWRCSETPDGIYVALHGELTHPLPSEVVDILDQGSSQGRSITIDLSGVTCFDPIFAGLLLRLEGRLGPSHLHLTGDNATVRRLLRWNGILGLGVG